ncbi:hypothetical protein RF11_03694 [Thelohanellus kitauei]|uniref:Uncharacterized protein n=1 Tax=Thelohanellus kitauei TaxID=669202 RepID=A0A0C2J0Y4_THEKT|nr:hypothetical protein RF11_03694 [Thelohanellus kitauei]
MNFIIFLMNMILHSKKLNFIKPLSNFQEETPDSSKVNRPSDTQNDTSNDNQIDSNNVSLPTVEPSQQEFQNDILNTIYPPIDPVNDTNPLKHYFYYLFGAYDNNKYLIV